MRLNGSQILSRCLHEEGVEVIFGIPGGTIMPLYDEMHKHPMRHLLVRHEQAAAHMADGYARVKRDVGVCMGTSGPGATNLVTGILNAHMDSSPLVAITVNVPSTMIGTDALPGGGHLGDHHPGHQAELLRPPHPRPREGRQGSVLHRPERPARPGPHRHPEGRPAERGRLHSVPGHVDLPGFQPNYEGSMVQIRKAARLIEHAKRPVIIAGQGVLISQASQELIDFAEKTNIPVVNTLLGLSGFPASHPLYNGWPGMHGYVHSSYSIDKSDLIIGIGNRFDDRFCGKFAAFAPKAKIVHIDIDPAEIGKNVRVDVPIVGDVKRVLEQADARRSASARATTNGSRRSPSGSASSRSSSTRTTRRICTRPRSSTPSTRPPSGKAMIVADVGQHQMFAAQYYRFDEPRMFQTSGGLGTMGYSLPAAIGAQCARPDKEVWAIAGDGCFQMNLQELAVLTQERIPVKIAVINNGYLGHGPPVAAAVLGRQLPARRSAPACRTSSSWPMRTTSRPGASPSRRGQAGRCDAARAHPGPALIEFRVFREENVFPMVPVRGLPVRGDPGHAVRARAPVATPSPGGRAGAATPTPVHAQGGSR